MYNPGVGEVIRSLDAYPKARRLPEYISEAENKSLRIPNTRVHSSNTPCIRPVRGIFERLTQLGLARPLLAYQPRGVFGIRKYRSGVAKTLYSVQTGAKGRIISIGRRISNQENQFLYEPYK